jgi:tetratricopeptide (TPR) repeat protein
MRTTFQPIALFTLLMAVLDWVNQLSAQSLDALRAGVVSTRNLAHKPPKAARREFDRGLRASEIGHNAEALQHFIAAVDADPEYLEGQAYLGRLYLLQGEATLGLEHLDRALSIEASSDVLHSNRAAALMMLKRPVEAEQAARQAVQLAPASIAAHYMLGLALLRQNRATPETALHLEIAVGKYPDVLPGLAWVRERLASTPRK